MLDKFLSNKDKAKVFKDIYKGLNNKDFIKLQLKVLLLLRVNIK